MKKLISIALVCVFVSALCLTAFAQDSTVVDVTSEAKFATVLDVYTDLLPVVRADAVFIDPLSYVNGNDEGFKAPGTATRAVFIDGIPFTDFFNDRFVVDMSDKENYAVFEYPAIWANNGSDGSPAKLVYNIDVPKDGVYEFVVVCCGQIKEADVDRDNKDRGFGISVDGGTDKRQVNISDTELVFREYEYTYSAEDVKNTRITTANGVNSSKYQVGYVYNLCYELTKGAHTVELWHLDHSGDTVMSGNGSRVNIMGVYVQEFVDTAEQPDNPSTGDNAMIIIVLAAIMSLAGTATAFISRRHS